MAGIPIFASRAAVPSYLAGLALEEVVVYPDPANGVSFRYCAAPHVKADAYLYTDGLPALPTDLNSPEAAALFHDAWAAVLSAAREGTYLDLAVLREPSYVEGSQPSVLWGRFSYRQAPGPAVQFPGVRVSELALRFDRGFINKVRYSYAEGRGAHAGEKGFLAFLAEWTAAINAVPAVPPRKWWQFWRRADRGSETQARISDVPRSKAPKPRWKILLHEAAAASNELAAAWSLYAGTKAFVRDGTYYESHPGAVGRTSPFDEEVFARDAMAELWAVQPAPIQATDQYLSLLVRVRAAGFLAEYVWTFLRQAEWSRPAELRMSAFEAWLAAEGVADHAPATLALLQKA